MDSAIIKLNTKKRLPKIDQNKFFHLIKAGFRSKRKMLKNNLSSNLGISPPTVEDRLRLAGIGEKCRAQEINLDDWLNLAKLIK